MFEILATIRATVTSNGWLQYELLPLDDADTQ